MVESAFKLVKIIGFFKMKKIILALLLPAICVIFANAAPKVVRVDKVVYLEALYGFGEMNYPQKGFIHEAQLRAIFPTTSAMHELLARGTFSQNTKSHDIDAKYRGYEVEYRLGMRMDSQFESMGMVLGSAYIGLGYQNVVQSYSDSRPRRNMHFLYIPVGFWGEDSMSDWGSFMANFKMRYGILTKMMFVDTNNSENKLKGHFLFGGKVYLGLAYKIADVVDIFAQGYFQYGTPIRNLRQYGLEVGIQF